ncbi:MAG: ABC transporter permease [Pseudobdellovibrionaceae bacterium]
MIFLALRYLLERKRQTLFTLLGVFLGTMAYVGVSGFFLGFQGFLVDQLVNNSAQIHIEARQDFINRHDLDAAFFDVPQIRPVWTVAPAGVLGFTGVQNPQAWYKRLDEDSRVIAYSPTLTAAALLSSGKISVGSSLIGCNPFQQSKVTSVADYVVEGHFTDIGSGGNRLILGDELMKRLGVAVNQTVMVSVGQHTPIPFKVIGRYFTGNRGADMQAYGALADIQKVNQTPNQVNEIGVRLSDYTQAQVIARSWSKLGQERVESWADLSANIFSVFAIQNALRASMILIVLVVAGFGIYNILNMTVNQKRQDIAILRALGYDTYDIVMLFFSQGLIIGVIGSIFGLICGYIFCRYLQTVSFNMPMTVPSSLSHLHISLNFWIYVQAFGLALITTSIASILPARAAGKLTPIDIIRQGG